MEPLRKVNIREKLDSFHETWKPKVLARVNEFAIKAVKIEGEFVWHHHDDGDEVFVVLRGCIDMRYVLNGRECVESFGEGELLRVPRGVEHKPVAAPGTEILLIEREDTVNTGNLVGSDRYAAAESI